MHHVVYESGLEYIIDYMRCPERVMSAYMMYSRRLVRVAQCEIYEGISTLFTLVSASSEIPA